MHISWTSVYFRNVPGVQWTLSVREVGDPSFILIALNVPTLTPHLNWTETMLQLSEDLIMTDQSQSYIMTNRQSVGQSVLVSSTHLELMTNFFFLLEIFFRQLQVCYFVAPPLTRGQVCNLLLLLVLASTVPLRSESRGTQDHIFLSQFLRLSQPGRPGPHIYIPQLKLKLKLIYDRQSVGQFWCQAPIWDPQPIFLSPWNFL
jgi:hypothetical protein